MILFLARELEDPLIPFDDELVLGHELPGSLVVLLIEASQYKALPALLALHILNNLLLVLDSLLKSSHSLKQAVNNCSVLLGHIPLIS